MRRRYLTGVRRFEEEEYAEFKEFYLIELYDRLTVYVPEREPRDTGLVDAYGNAIMAVEEVEPIGFVRHGM